MLTMLLSLLTICHAFVANHPRVDKSGLVLRLQNDNNEVEEDTSSRISRRSILFNAATASTLLTTATAAKAEDQPPSFVQEYADFTESPTGGWRYRTVQEGKGGVKAQKGDRVVFDWSGYTIGYFGRPFQAKGGPTGGAFDKELDYSRTIIGSGAMIPALEQALADMEAGTIRQVVVPWGDLTYPADDPSHERVGPKPSTFSGMRALNFVLDNPRLDRTLLFNVKVIRVDKKDGKGGFIRG